MSQKFDPRAMVAAGAFDVDPNNLIEEARTAPRLLADLAVARADARIAASNARLELDSTAARESLRLRGEAELTGKKTTEGAIEAAMRASSEWQVAAETKGVSEAEETLLGDLFRAADAKVGIVQSLIKIQATEMRA